MSVLFEYNFSFPFIPHSYQNVTSPTLSPKPLSFLAPPPIRSKSASRTAYQIPKSNTITQTPTPKASKKAIPRPTPTKFQKQTPQKDNPKQSIKPHQLQNPAHPGGRPLAKASRTAPGPPRSPPLKTHTPHNARTFPRKRKCICLQTPMSLLPNAKAFHLKRKDVCPQTQARFPPQNLPIIPHPASPNAPKSLKTRSPRLQIPPSLSISHPSHPLQKPSERGSLSNPSRESPQKQNQKATQITTQAAKRNQTAQIEINPEICYKAPDSPWSKPSFFPSPSYKMREKVCSFHKK